MSDVKELTYEVVKITGRCPVFEMGDKIVIKPPEIDLERTDALCINVLPSQLHYSIAFSEGEGADPRSLGLSKSKDEAFIHCLDPGEPYTEGGTVVFRITWKDVQ